MVCAQERGSHKFLASQIMEFSESVLSLGRPA